MNVHDAESRRKIAEIGEKFIKSKGVGYEFLRSAVSSQAASWADMLTGFLLFSLLDMSPWLSTGIGAVLGGIINCIINYKFTFRAQDCPWKAVVVKYVLVWVGSVTLNAYGTDVVYWLLMRWQWLEEIGFRPDGFYAAARLGVSLLVSWAWNFLLQRNFVYRITRFDNTAIRIVDFLTFHFKKS